MFRRKAARQPTVESAPDATQSPAAERVNGEGRPQESLTRETSRQGNGADRASTSPSAPNTKSNVEMITEAAAKLDITDEDVIIAVMGLTGVGKSTFIKYLSDSEILIGHDLNSCTINVAVHPFFLNDGRRAYLVDTPGFDDGKRTEAEILQEISNFFAATYKMHIKLAGVIYLHRVSDNRMSKSMFKNLRMMKKLCGEGCYSKIILATTMWDTMAADMPKAIQNEAQLADTHDWWGDLLEAGATTMRQDDGWRSAMKIVQRIMSFNAPAVMANQVERVDQNLALKDCESGKVVAEELLKQAAEHEQEMAEKRALYEEQIKQGKASAAAKLANLENKHKEEKEKMDQANAILSQKFTDSNKALQAQIDKHNDEMKAARQARSKADTALNNAVADLNTFKTKQAEKELEWEATQRKNSADLAIQIQAERERNAQTERDLTAKYDAMLQNAQTQRNSTGSSVMAAVTGAVGVLAGVMTLNIPLAVGGAAMMAGGGAKTAYEIRKK